MKTIDTYHEGILKRLKERYEDGAYSEDGYKAMVSAVKLSAQRMAAESPEMGAIRKMWGGLKLAIIDNLEGREQNGYSKTDL